MSLTNWLIGRDNEIRLEGYLLIQSMGQHQLFRYILNIVVTIRKTWISKFRS